MSDIELVEDHEKKGIKMKEDTEAIRKLVSVYMLEGDLLENIWDNIPAILFYKDKENKLIKVNKYFTKILGVKKSDVEGKNINDLMDNQILAAKYASNDIEVINNGVSRIGILEELFDTGIKLRTDKFPVRKNGKVCGVLGFSVIL